jgi:hypothetical protein
MTRGQELFAVLVLRSASWCVKPRFHKQKVQALQRRGLMTAEGILTDEGWVLAKRVQRKMYFDTCAPLRIDHPEPGQVEMIRDPKGYYPALAFEDIRRFGLVAYQKRSGFTYIKQIFETVEPHEIYMIGLGRLFYGDDHKVDENRLLDQIFATIPRPEFERGGSCVVSWQELVTE